MDTVNVLLAHIQARIHTLQGHPQRSLTDRARLNELELILNVLKAANDLQRLAEPQKERTI